MTRKSSEVKTQRPRENCVFLCKSDEVYSCGETWSDKKGCDLMVISWGGGTSMRTTADIFLYLHTIFSPHQPSRAGYGAEHLSHEDFQGRREMVRK
jgi:hypothetical protein